jgi:hypothetical protein
VLFLRVSGLGVREIEAIEVRIISKESKETVPFKLPMVFTIGPHRPMDMDMAGFLTYARKMSMQCKRRNTHGKKRD